MAESLRIEKAMSNVLALILAGGKVERLSPPTIHRAKTAVPFGGLYRITDFTPGSCANSNVAIPKGVKTR
jgi:glucose-1-phosphate adenylyltransferase